MVKGLEDEIHEEPLSPLVCSDQSRGGSWLPTGSGHISRLPEFKHHLDSAFNSVDYQDIWEDARGRDTAKSRITYPEKGRVVVCEYPRVFIM